MATRRREDYRDNYQEDIEYDVDNGNFIKGKYDENERNSKIADGYGGGQAPTYNFNYQNKWDNKIQQKRNEYENYAPFSYDYKTDDNYINLANLYSKNARDTAKNAIAQAAAVNGGRAGTNAVIAASLGYGQKMSELEGEIPELRQLAHNMYRQDKEDIRTTMNDYIAQDATDYGRFSDNYNRMYTNARDMIGDKQFDRTYEQSDRQFNKTNDREWAGIVANTNLQEKTLAQNDAQFNKTNDRAWAELGWDVDSLRRNDAITTSLALGYVTKDASEILGVPEGTQTHDAKIEAGDQLISLAELVGYVSPSVAQKFGYDYSGPTVEATNQAVNTSSKVKKDYADVPLGYEANQSTETTSPSETTPETTSTETTPTEKPTLYEQRTGQSPTVTYTSPSPSNAGGGGNLNYNTQSQPSSSQNTNTNTNTVNESTANSYASAVWANIDNYDDPIDAINAIVPPEYRNKVKQIIAGR